MPLESGISLEDLDDLREAVHKEFEVLSTVISNGIIKALNEVFRS
jgi:hypothetical protein